MPAHWYWKKRRTQLPVNPFAVQRGGMSYGTVGHTGPAPAYQVAAPSPVVIKDLGLAIEPIVGYRAFNLIDGDGDDIFLLSFNSTVWPQRKALRATCGGNLLAAHDAPNEKCQCGIYAWNKASAMHPFHVGMVWGEVYLWGDVLIGDAGYRAEFSYPKELHIVNPTNRQANYVRAALEEGYGVPVTLSEVSPPEPVEDTFDVTTFGSSYPQFLPPGTPPSGYTGPTTPSYMPPPPFPGSGP